KGARRLVSAAPSRAFAALALRLHCLELRVHRDLGLEHAGDRAAGLRVLSRGVELRLVCARNAPGHVEMNLRARRFVPGLDRELRLGLDALRLEPELSELG